MEGKIFRLGPAAGGKGMLPKLAALVALLTGVVTLTVVAIPPHPPPPPPTVEAQMATMDYDVDDNGLIEVSNLDQLNAMRWDLDGDGDPAAANASSYLLAFPDRDAATSTRMGCPMGNCAGYELMADLTFPAETSSPYNPWTPIGSYNATLEGNGNALTDLRVDVAGHAGLFAILSGSSAVRNLELVNPSVTSTAGGVGAGALAGRVNSGASIDSIAVRGGRIAVSVTSGSFLWAGGLAGVVDTPATVSNSYSGAHVAVTASIYTNQGGLIGTLGGRLINSYAYGGLKAPAGTGFNKFVGGLVGFAGQDAVAENNYCDTDTSTSTCLGQFSATFAANRGLLAGRIEGKTTAELQTPTGYDGIYRNWNLDLDGDGRQDQPWNFGTESDYPALNTPEQRAALMDSSPPGGPRYAQPPQDTPYDPAADHPEVYVNDRWDMAVDCEAQTGDDGAAEGSLIRFDLGRYEGAVILHLAVWNGEFFMSYESQDIAMPPFEREGQSATVRVVTAPAQTRFLLDSVSPTTNLVLGYADCHTDDPGAVDSAEPVEAAETSTAATPAPPKVYVNERYGMTATCDVVNNADGEPESALITFDLGSYQGDVLLSMSLWNGEWYASYESLDIDPPDFQRDGQSATVLVATDPAETRFLLDGTPNGLRMNLLLGYADCHTAGE